MEDKQSKQKLNEGIPKNGNRKRGFLLLNKDINQRLFSLSDKNRRAFRRYQ